MCYVWTKRRKVILSKRKISQLFLTANKYKLTKGNLILVSLSGRDFSRIEACVLQILKQKKPLQIEILFCRKIRSYFGKVMEMQPQI